MRYSLKTVFAGAMVGMVSFTQVAALTEAETRILNAAIAQQAVKIQQDKALSRRVCEQLDPVANARQIEFFSALTSQSPSFFALMRQLEGINIPKEPFIRGVYQAWKADLDITADLIDRIARSLMPLFVNGGHR